jgi:hypothetical protein
MIDLWTFPRAVTCFHCGKRHAGGEVTHMFLREDLPHAICNGCHTPAHLWYVDDSHESPTSGARVAAVHDARKRRSRLDS